MQRQSALAGALTDVRIVSLALNLPGPAALAQARAIGAACLKIEPPSGDAMREYSKAFYAQLHRGVRVQRLDLKTDAGRLAFHNELARAHILLTSFRPSALARLGLSWRALHAVHPRLFHVAIEGERGRRAEHAGHDLTYLASRGLVTPPLLPPTLWSDMAASLEAAKAILAAALLARAGAPGRRIEVAIGDAAQFLAWPRQFGLLAHDALLGGGSAAYNLYATADGWIALAALEPHFQRALLGALGVTRLSRASLTRVFRTESTAHWVAFARKHDLPIAALAAD